MSLELKKLFELKGVIGAVEFQDDGHLIASAGDIPEKVAKLLSDLFATNMKMARLQAHMFTEVTGAKGFEDELTGFAMMGNELSFCIIENVAVIVKNSEADFNDIYETLSLL